MTTKPLKVTKAFKKDTKRLKKTNRDFAKLYRVLSYLEKGRPVPKKYHPHRLSGQFKGFMECHLESDWLLIWRNEGDVITLVRMGSHSQLFKK